MRLFLAIDLPTSIKESLHTSYLQSIQQEHPYLNWVPMQNYHVTVQFFGELGEDKLKAFTTRIRDCLFDASAFELSFLTGGVFIRHNIVLYVDFYRQKKLEHIAQRIREDLDLRDSPKYIPHITIARYKKPSKQQYFLLKKTLEQTKIDLQFEVTHLTLFQSIPSSQAPVYKEIERFSLYK